MATEITATDAARRFSELLNRVRYRGECFVIVRNGERVASLTAAASEKPLNLRELTAQLKVLRTGDPDFADDLERIVAEQPRVRENPWGS